MGSRHTRCTSTAFAEQGGARIASAPTSALREIPHFEKCGISARLAVVAMLVSAVSACPSEGLVEVTPTEAKGWLRHVIPLPKQVELSAKVVTTPASVSLVPPAQHDLLTAQAVDELRACLRQPADRSDGAGATFAITLQLGGDEAGPLRELQNWGQAYRLFPEPNGEGLRLVALTSSGLFYAAKTLAQLITARATEGRVEVPLATIADWPDMAERGLWGSDSFLHLKMLGDVKMNLCEQIAYVWVDEEGRGHGKLKPGREPMVDEGPKYGIRPLPAVVHLSQLKGKGLLEAYPNLVAQGGDEGALCLSQPEIVNVLADWIVELGSLPHVTDVSVWLTENLHGKGGCTCAQCAQHDRNVLETQVVLRAWELAKQRWSPSALPTPGLRILLSEETYRSNAKILEILPKDVKLTYYHSLLTYTTFRRPMIEPLFARWCEQGGYLGVTPQLTGDVGPATPFTGAAFVHYRMNEFVDKGVSCLTGYATPRLQHCRFNVEAAAEWSWNAKGRTTREFAESYAVRHGIADPGTFEEWSETIGPVAWRLYGSEWPAGERRKALTPVVEALRAGTLPELGHVKWGLYAKPWGQYQSATQLSDDLAAATRAVALARKLAVPETVEESLVIEGYAKSLGALWELKQVVTPAGIAAQHKDAARNHFGDFTHGCDQSAGAVRRWSQLVAPDVGTNAGSRYWKVAEILERLGTDMRALSRELDASSTDATEAP